MSALVPVLTPRRRALTLAAACLAQGMILLDITIVNVALPDIGTALSMSPARLEWVVNAYTLVLAALILVGGTLGDRYGRRRWLLIGLAVFTLGSALGATAGSEAALFAARAVQGLGGAAMAALTLSILVDAYPPQRRAGAIGVWAAAAGIGFGAGPILGGILVAWFGWAAIFWVNVPLGAAAVVVTLLGVRESRDPAARRADPVGAALGALGLFLLTLGLVEAGSLGWGSPAVLGCLVGSAVLLTSFVLWERRVADPMLPPALLAHRSLAAGSVVFALLYLGLTGMFFFVTLLFQSERGWSALATGLSWLCMNVPFLLVSLRAGAIAGRFGAGRQIAAGCLLGGVGIGVLAVVGLQTPFAVAVIGYVLLGLGYGLAVPAVSTAAMADVDPAEAGIGSGVLNTARQIGSSVGLAVLGAVGAAGGAVAGADPEQFLGGYRWAMAGAAVAVLAGAWLAWALLRRPAVAQAVGT